MKLSVSLLLRPRGKKVGEGGGGGVPQATGSQEVTSHPHGEKGQETGRQGPGDRPPVAAAASSLSLLSRALWARGNHPAGLRIK